jgi:uncharacterized RDD family membrane protein YckC
MTYDTASAPESAAGAASGPRAGFWRRLGAAFLDGLVLSIPQFVLIAVLPDAAAVIYVLFLIIQIGYYVYLEGGETGQTIGKRALGIRVYDLRQGGPIGYGRAFIRYIGRYVSSIVILLGYLWMLWDGEKQTWHDKFAGSVVVPTDAYPTN